VFSYLAYGLKIASELRLPELISLAPPAVDGGSDVMIRFADSPSFPSPPTTVREANAAEVLLCYEQVGTFLVREGREVWIDRKPEVVDYSLRLLVLGPVLGILLHQRGHLVLHGSAVAKEGKAIAFLGNSGWGKSTTAAAFHQRGYTVVADDLVAVQINPDGSMIWPGFPRLKLWPEAADYLKHDPTLLSALHPKLPKLGLTIQHNFATVPLSLSQIYILTEGEATQIEPLSSSAAFPELMRHSYALSLLQKTERSGSHFSQCGQLIQSVPISRLRRPQLLSELSTVTQLVETHSKP
jgi:hypothetical protein